MTFDPRDHINPADTDYAELWHDDVAHPFAPLPAYEREIERLREECAFKSVELLARDRVIARLLDGWQWQVDPPDEPGLWIREYPWTESDEEPMSDGEAAIIRNHQEKTASHARTATPAKT